MVGSYNQTLPRSLLVTNLIGQLDKKYVIVDKSVTPVTANTVRVNGIWRFCFRFTTSGVLIMQNLKIMPVAHKHCAA